MRTRAGWDHVLDIRSIWHDDDTTAQEKGRLISAKIKTQHWYNDDLDHSFNWAVEEIGEIPDDLPEDEAIEEFDGWWSDIYDWADTGRRLWIQII